MTSKTKNIEIRILVRHRGAPVMELPLQGVRLGIGSGEDNDVRLVGEGVETHHLILRRRGRRWIALAPDGACVADGAGRRSPRVLLEPGTTVSVGEFTLHVQPPGNSCGGTETETLATRARQRVKRIEMRLVASSGCSPASVDLGRSSLTLGRDPSCDLVLDDPTASQLHARIVPASGGWIVTDLGSRNGTRVDGRLVDGAELEEGSTICLGRTVLECRSRSKRGGCEAGWLVTTGLDAVVEEVVRCARTALPVLITGESGTGKEGCARRLHVSSTRSSGPFIPVNCAALPDSLADSVLFGHSKGAFTGADQPHEGLVLASSGGSLFLDEVGELSLSSQARLLRVLEEDAVRAVGATRTVGVDLRVVAATNRNLSEMAADGLFRFDLLHRIAVLGVHLPSLRDRREDIGQLVDWFLATGAVKASGISQTALSILECHDWPGNVRELRNVLSRASVRSGGGQISGAHIDFIGARGSHVFGVCAMPETMAEARALMERASGNVAKAARSVGVARSTLRDRLRKLEDTSYS